ncbi:hypothetical protein [Bacillus sp. RO1]|uniref:hypothetical protein n=1 Tax=Bacillus sp. RO1 TaxID=2722703 RepID=UPI00145756B4|nr:hypothetical protein [Bacillus sp. RO1]NLP50085.1 hypothetical protein [Bacillus sp. RO1]
MIGDKKNYLIYVVLIMLFLTACNSPNEITEYMREVDSTNLSGEAVDGIELGMKISNETFIKSYGRAEQDPDNHQYSEQGRQYDQYWLKGLWLGIYRETKEILSLSIIDNKTSYVGDRIVLGDSIEKVISEYGEFYYTYQDLEQSIYIIGYVDHSNNLHLSFTHSKGKVSGINLSYAFDKLLWN